MVTLRKIPAFDGLRGLCVAAVLLTHLPRAQNVPIYNALWSLDRGASLGVIGVDIFFALSGFLITRILLSEKAATGSVSFARFYERRALRIFPIYYIAIIVCFYVFHFSSSDVALFAIYGFNFYQPFAAGSNPLEHTWSLCVEEQFYFLWPFLISFVPRRYLFLLTGAIVPAMALVTGLVIGIVFASDDKLSGNLVYMLPFTRMITLSLGGFLATCEFERRIIPVRSIVAAMVGGVVLLLVDHEARNLKIITSQGIYWTICIAGTACFSLSIVTAVSLSREGAWRWVQAALSLAPLRGLGRISYGLYLYHLPVIYYLGLNEAVTRGRPFDMNQILLAIAMSLALAITSYFLIEAPLLGLRPRYRAVNG